MVLAGIAVLVMDGVNKQSIVSGPLLVYIGAAVYLHNQYWLGYSPLVALGMMILGCLLLLSRSDAVKFPYKSRKGIRKHKNYKRKGIHYLIIT